MDFHMHAHISHISDLMALYNDYRTQRFLPNYAFSALLA
jgi:hypothetical protein